MPIKVQQGRTLGALLQEFGIKGRHLLQLDEVIVPVAVVADVRPSDVAGSIFREHDDVPAVALENPVIEFSGAPRFACLPVFLNLLNPAAGTEFLIRVLETPAILPVFTNLGSTNGIDGYNITRAGPCQIRTGSFPIAGLGGNLIARVEIPAGETQYFIPPEIFQGIRLKANEQMYVIGNTANQAVEFSFGYRVETLD